ncbi:MAG: ABC transporter ATP-binding protein [Halobacteriales archaeon]
MQVLYDLSMHLRDGEVVCMIGPNGAGKSTVLKAVFGLLGAWSGRVNLHGTEITGLAPEDVVREGVGYVPQVDNVFGTLSVEENLRMGGVSVGGGLGSTIGRLSGQIPMLAGSAGGDRSVSATIEELYDRFPMLAEKRGDKARTLSGGQQQILAFARALMTDPDVLLIDEPSAGLAPNTAADVFDRVRRVNEAGTAILMVEQNARAGLDISDRGYVLDQGTVRFEGAADELLENPEVAELYLGG